MKQLLHFPGHAMPHTAVSHPVTNTTELKKAANITVHVMPHIALSHPATNITEHHGSHIAVPFCY
jgi:hypothetical protein